MSTMSKTISVNCANIRGKESHPEGSFVKIGGRQFYRIANYDSMAPFFISIVSSSDHWIYLSTTGGITAGRIDPDNAIFPYYTEDKVTENGENTGSVTVIRVEKSEGVNIWEPFANRYGGLYEIERNLYKSETGDSIIFEEVNLDLGLTFRYAWQTSDRYGLVRRSELVNHSAQETRLEILDGIRNILPYGANQQVQNEISCLLDAYKRSELVAGTTLAIYSMSSILTDRAEPSEALRATTTWSAGLGTQAILLTEKQLASFRSGRNAVPENDVRAHRGAYLACATLSLQPHEEKKWHIVTDINKDRAGTAELIKALENTEKLIDDLQKDIARGEEKLVYIVGSSDGLQASKDKLTNVHHFANVMFNVMRGGVFANNYRIEISDLIEFMRAMNRPLAKKHEAHLRSLGHETGVGDLIKHARKQNDPQLVRLCYEYLPITFSRRHGDPSRPWNRFAIKVKDSKGDAILNFQGNWRDIFQNWEALSLSYPEFMEHMICKFVNASTVDGYNPYRITRDGIDWEEPEPGNPWSNIGYWGDHQVIYLQKLLEWSVRFHPERLRSFLVDEIFSYANVPYEIKPYAEILRNAYNTIRFDEEKNERIGKLTQDIGADGKLVLDSDGGAVLVNLTEKLLVMILTKLSNFVPEGGIWMNTQRPEWNDANNALVGNGLSMVTACYLRRCVKFCESLYEESGLKEVSLSSEVHGFLDAITAILKNSEGNLIGPYNDAERRKVVDALSSAGSEYRQNFYKRGVSGEKTEIKTEDIANLFRSALRHLDHTIKANLRSDGLYHSYNLITFAENSASVSYLYEMLEGQVAALSSGSLSPAQAADVFAALRKSSLYRADQHSYILYPDRNLPGFMSKNNIPEEMLSGFELAEKMLANRDNAILYRDAEGQCHFNSEFRNAECLATAIDKLSCEETYGKHILKDKDRLLAIYESIFDHKYFTGRSGSFFAYEGLGSIYWHMVSKLMLTAQEQYFAARESGAGRDIVERLAKAYYDIREGIGFNKTPEVYGAFPTDPYSHTPAHSGARQPGMTGQVKEEVITRLGETGISVREGMIFFSPTLLRKREFLSAPSTFTCRNLDGSESQLELHASEMAFTLCQTPVVYHLGNESKIVATMNDGTEAQAKSSLPFDLSQSIFRREGKCVRIDVWVDEAGLFTE
ncbi:MAG: hypothetical protein JXR97_15190 [Planctomycetes bacterium]|nr:hypothetical protein [Planctomycetota bacterium]